jgi:hypothetical protein
LILAETIKRNIFALFCINQTFKHMNIEQIKNELVLLIAQLTEAEFPDVENIREAVDIIFNQNSKQ